MSQVLYLPFVAQGVLMGVDELWFHRRRGLPRWERVGHPVDTMSVAACLAIAVFAPHERPFVAGYLILAAISCLLITKDELVHSGRCTPWEHWVHAMLFVLHPLVLGAAFMLWALGRLPEVLLLQLVLVGAFLVYQIVYWNVVRTE